MRGWSRPDAAKEQFWRKALARLSVSGLTKGQFCKREGLDPDLLRYWSQAIAKRDRERPLVEASQDKVTERTFLPVIVSSQKANDRLPGTRQMAVAEMVIAGGSVFLFNGITVDTVRALWLALRENGR